MIIISFFYNFPALANLGGLDSTAGSAGYKQGDLATFAGSALGIALGLVGVIFFIIIIFSGFTWMTSMGNETKISTAKKMLVAGAIGLIIVLGAYVIVYSLGSAIKP